MLWRRYNSRVGVATKTTVEISELESDGQLLRFRSPLTVEVDAAEGAYGLWMPVFELGVAGRDKAEAWEMLAELIIANYLDYRSVGKAPRYPLARKQWVALRGTVSGFYVLQRD